MKASDKMSKKDKNLHNNKTENKLNFRQKVRAEIRDNKKSLIVFSVLFTFVLLVFIRSIFNGNYENSFLCLLTMFLLVLPAMLQVQFKIQIPTLLEIIILIFIFAAEILGEIGSFYVIVPFWDTILHTVNGFLAAAIGVSLINILNEHQRVAFKLSPIFVAITGFCFSMTIGVVWEFFEFGMDVYFDIDMQKDTVINVINSVLLNPENSTAVVSIKGIESTVINGSELGINGYLDIGLYDTMEDLFVNFIGAVVFSIMSFFYSKNKGKGRGDIVYGFLLSKNSKNDKDYAKILENTKTKRRK